MSQPKILLLDIETAPGEAYIWNIWDKFIPIDRIKNPPRVLCWGAKWLGKSEMFYADERGGVAKMFEKIYDLMNEADAIVTYNGDRFDIPRLRGAFVEQGLGALPPITSIDLLKTVRKLGLLSNKLAYVAPKLDIGEKVKTQGFGLWTKCMSGDKNAWKRMRVYNERDVKLLGRLYNVLRPHINNHPRLFARSQRPNCGACGSSHIQFRGRCFTEAYEWSRFECQNCGKWSKIRKTSDGERNKKSP